VQISSFFDLAAVWRHDHLRCVQNERNTKMIKSSIIALVAVAAMGSVAVPAFAAAGDLGGEPKLENAFPADAVLVRLQQNGVPAVSVEEWGGLVRAFVALPDGGQTMQFFAPHTLQPATL